MNEYVLQTIIETRTSKQWRIEPRSSNTLTPLRVKKDPSQSHRISSQSLQMDYGCKVEMPTNFNNSSHPQFLAYAASRLCRTYRWRRHVGIPSRNRRHEDVKGEKNNDGVNLDRNYTVRWYLSAHFSRLGKKCKIAQDFAQNDTEHCGGNSAYSSECWRSRNLRSRRVGREVSWNLRILGKNIQWSGK